LQEIGGANADPSTRTPGLVLGEQQNKWQEQLGEQSWKTD
jgi:hypothetical protein